LSLDDIAALGKVGLIICGNHAIRAAVAAMQRTFRRILAERAKGHEPSLEKIKDRTRCS
jgi:hypothetical protein